MHPRLYHSTIPLGLKWSKELCPCKLADKNFAWRGGCARLALGTLVLTIPTIPTPDVHPPKYTRVDLKPSRQSTLHKAK